MYFYTFEIICCPRCFSKHLHKFGHDPHGFQKYRCLDCFRQFTLNPQSRILKGYPICPRCHRQTFLWHRYDTYLHFKCGSKLCNHSLKLPIPPPDHLLVSDELIGVFSFSHFRFPPHIILLALTLYFDGCSSTRSIKRFFSSAYGIKVSHVTIHSWTRIFAPWFRFLSDQFLPLLDFQSDEWHVDETYIKIKGVTHYLWLILDSETRTILHFVLSDNRGASSAFELLYWASQNIRASPLTIVSDHWDAYNEAIVQLYPHSTHYKYESFQDCCSNNVIESFNKTFKAWYKTKKGFKTYQSALQLITTFIFHYNFLHQHSSMNYLSPAQVAGATVSQMDQAHWLLY